MIWVLQILGKLNHEFSLIAHLLFIFIFFIFNSPAYSVLPYAHARTRVCMFVYVRVCTSMTPGAGHVCGGQGVTSGGVFAFPLETGSLCFFSPASCRPESSLRIPLSPPPIFPQQHWDYRHACYVYPVFTWLLGI